jgi:hypothetical protein
MRRTDHPSGFRAGIISRAPSIIEAASSSMHGELAPFPFRRDAVCRALSLDAWRRDEESQVMCETLVGVVESKFMTSSGAGAADASY